MSFKKKLQATAKAAFFNKMPHLAFVYACEDGNFFYPESFNAAQSHAGTRKLFILNRDPKKDELVNDSTPSTNKTTIGETDKGDAPREYKTSSKELVRLLKKVVSNEELSKLATDQDMADEDRKTVLIVYNKMLEKFPATQSNELAETNSDYSDDELIKLVSETVTEAELDKLEASYNLSKHENDEVIKAFESKEDHFLNQ